MNTTGPSGNIARIDMLGVKSNVLWDTRPGKSKEGTTKAEVSETPVAAEMASYLSKLSIFVAEPGLPANKSGQNEVVVAFPSSS